MNHPQPQKNWFQALLKRLMNKTIGIGAVLLLAAVSHAQLIDVNFQTTWFQPLPISGAAAIGSPGDQWNTFAGGGGGNVAGGGYFLNDTTGADSGLTLIMGTAFYDGADNRANAWPVFFKGDLFKLKNSTWAAGPTTITITGFTPGEAVNLLLYSTYGYGTFTFANLPKVTYGFSATFTPGNYVEFDGLVADSTGKITGTWDYAPGSGYTTLCGMQIKRGAGVTAASLAWATQPVSHNAYAGGGTTFTALATGGNGSGTGNYTYQWYQNTVLMTGQTNSTLKLINVTTNMSGYVYYATASDGVNTITSTNATLLIAGLKLLDVNFSQGNNIYAPSYPLAFSGAAAIGSPGDQWNTISAAPGGNAGGTYSLNDVTGAGSGVSLTIGTVFYDGTDKSSYGSQTLYKGDLFIGGAPYYAGPTTIKLAGFAPGKVVNLILYGYGAAFTFANVTNTATAQGGDETTFGTGNYSEFDGLVADNTGSITGTWDFAPGSGFSELFGLQVNTGIVTTPADQVGSAIISNNPIAYYRLDEAINNTTVHDYLGNNNGTYGIDSTNSVAGPVPPGFPGFYSGNSSVQTTGYDINSDPVLPPLGMATNTLTIVAWINPAGQQNPWAGIVYYGDGLNNYNTTTSLGLDVQGYHNDYNVLGYQWNAQGWQVDTGLRIPNNQWSLAAVVVTPTNATLYVGANNTLSSYVDVRNQPVQDLSIGNGYIGLDPWVADLPNRTFNGKIDDVAIFNYALSPSAIQAIYHAAVTVANVAPTNVVARISNITGTNKLVITGTGGSGGSGYTVLTSTNLTTALANWSTNATGVPFGVGGSVNFTNSINQGTPQVFYRIRVP